jgi:hypothetical protein
MEPSLWFDFCSKKVKNIGCKFAFSCLDVMYAERAILFGGGVYIEGQGLGGELCITMVEKESFLSKQMLTFFLNFF